MNATPHESRSKFSPIQSPLKAMSEGECSVRIRQNSGAARPQQKLPTVALLQLHNLPTVSICDTDATSLLGYHCKKVTPDGIRQSVNCARFSRRYGEIVDSWFWGGSNDRFTHARHDARRVGDHLDGNACRHCRHVPRIFRKEPASILRPIPRRPNGCARLGAGRPR
jgi:hypothetical protein